MIVTLYITILHPHSHFWSLFSPFEWPYLVVFLHFLHRQILRVPLYPILAPIAVVLDTSTQTYLPMTSRWSFHCWVSMPAFKCWWPCGWHARERGRTDHAVRGKILRDTHLVAPSLYKYDVNNYVYNIILYGHLLHQNLPRFILCWFASFTLLHYT